MELLEDKLGPSPSCCGAQLAVRRITGESEKAIGEMGR